MIIQPNIISYLILAYDSSSKKTPRYCVIKQIGFYKPLEYLKDKNGIVKMYLLQRRENQPSNSPMMWLQAKSSLNFSGLKDYFTNGKISGYAYGYPNSNKTYSKNNIINPFYNNRNDGFIFIIHQKNNEIIPSYIEIIVLKNAKVLISSYCKQLIIGGYDEALISLRKQANINFNING